MTETPSAAAPPNRPRPFLLRAVLAGGLTGLIVAGGYALLALAGWALYLLVTNFDPDRAGAALLGAAVLGVAVLPICGWPFALAVGVLPATAVGAGIGLICGLAVSALRGRASPFTGAIIGASIGIALAALANIRLAADMVAQMGVGLYGFWLGGPSLLLPLGSTFIGRQAVLLYGSRGRNGG